MTVIKIEGKLGANAAASLERLAGPLYNTPGMRIVGVVELAHVERTQPAPDEDKDAVVRLAIKGLEIGREEQEHALRRALRALFLHRTAQGTLDDHGDVDLSQRTLDLLAGELHATEAARLRAALGHWQAYARQMLGRDATKAQQREDLATLADGLAAALALGGD